MRNFYSYVQFHILFKKYFLIGVLSLSIGLLINFNAEAHDVYAIDISQPQSNLCVNEATDITVVITSIWREPVMNYVVTVDLFRTGFPAVRVANIPGIPINPYDTLVLTSQQKWIPADTGDAILKASVVVYQDSTENYDSLPKNIRVNSNSRMSITNILTGTPLCLNSPAQITLLVNNPNTSPSSASITLMVKQGETIITTFDPIITHVINPGDTDALPPVLWIPTEIHQMELVGISEPVNLPCPGKDTTKKNVYVNNKDKIGVNDIIYVNGTPELNKPATIKFDITNNSDLTAVGIISDIIIINPVQDTTHLKDTSNITIPPLGNAQIQINEQYVPKIDGLHQLSANITSPVYICPDINPFYDEFDVAAPNGGLSFLQNSFEEPMILQYSASGYAKFSYDNSTETRYLNIMATLNPDTPGIWLAYNLIIPVWNKSTSIYYPIDFNVLGFTAGNKISDIYVDYKLTNTPLTSEWTWDIRNATRFDVAENQIIIGKDGVLNTPDDSSYQVPVYFKPDMDGQADLSVNRNCDVPNINLDSTKNPPTKGYAGDKNACAPASAANSLQWLEDTNDKIKTNKTLREKLTELSGMMKRAANSGADLENIIKGKLEFINKYKLPISVKYQGLKKPTVDCPSNRKLKATKSASKGDKVTWDFIESEMKDDEDLELIGDVYLNGVKIGSHAVTITGCGTKGGKKVIVFKHDENQKGDKGNDDGTREEQAELETDKDGNMTISYTTQDGKSVAIKITSVISESYDENVKFPEKGKTGKQSMNGGGSNKNYSFKGLPDNDGWMPKSSKFVNGYVKLGNNKSMNIIRNLPVVPPIDPDLTGGSFFDVFAIFEGTELAKSGFKSGKEEISAVEPDSILMKIYFSDSLLYDDITIDDSDWFWYPVEKNNAPESKFNSLDDSNYVIGDDFTQANFVWEGSEPEFKDSIIADLNSQLIDLNSQLYNSQTVQGYSGDMGASAPAVFSDLIGWIESKNLKVKSNLSQREKLELLSEFMYRSIDKGADRLTVIRGILRLIDSLKLPLKATFQSFRIDSQDIVNPVGSPNIKATNENVNIDRSPDWNWINNQLREDGLLAMEIGWYDSTKRENGNWVVVNGTYKQNGARRIIISDDVRQDTAGGIEMFSFIVDSSSGGKSYLYQLSSEQSRCYIETVVSLAYDSTVIQSVDEKDFDKSKIDFSAYPVPVENHEVIKFNINNFDCPDFRITISDLDGRKIAVINHSDLEESGNQYFWNYSKFKINLTSQMYIAILDGCGVNKTTKILR